MSSGHESIPVAAIAALQEGNKILAIKVVREATGLGLKESNDLVSAYIASRPELRERFGAIAERGRRGCLIAIGAVVAAVVAVIVSQQFADSGSQTVVTDAWSGRWTGVEGSWLEIAGSGGSYRITIQDLDSARTFDGSAVGDGLVFQRDGATETLHATDGKATGMKWLAEKRNCLTVKIGEGYCRD